jgi:hypothetical protein
MTARMRAVKHRSRIGVATKTDLNVRTRLHRLPRLKFTLGVLRDIARLAMTLTSSAKRQGGQLKEGGGSSTPAFMPPGCLRTAPVAGRSKQPEWLTVGLNIIRRSREKFIHAIAVRNRIRRTSTMRMNASYRLLFQRLQPGIVCGKVSPKWPNIFGGDLWEPCRATG